MAPVDREKEIAIGTVTVFLVWSASGIGGGEPIIVKLVKYFSLRGNVTNILTDELYITW